VSIVRARRPVLLLAIVLVAGALVAGAIILYRWATSDDDLGQMKDYPPARQQEAARSIVDGLNSRDPKNVDLLRNHSDVPDAAADNAQIDHNIEAAMPPPGCHYVLESVHDRGDQGVQKLPWFSPHQTRRFDMQIQQVCPGEPTISRTIGVLAIPSGMGGYWAEASLITDQ
jgi:hypothetical protein